MSWSINQEHGLEITRSSFEQCFLCREFNNLHAVQAED